MLQVAGTRGTRSFGIIKDRVNSKGKRIHHKSPGVARFCCVDGEGINVAGEHRYALFGIDQDQLINEDGFTWKEIFEFLYSHYVKGVAFCGFFLGYDFNQIFKTLPEERARMLLTQEGRDKRKRIGKNPSPWPVECDGWEFDILAMKRLKIRPKRCDHRPMKGKKACKCRKAPWMSICDTGSFFQQSFLAMIDPKGWKEPIVTPEEYAKILAGKQQRADKTCVDAEMMEYNRLENEILGRVLRELDKGFREIGVTLPPFKWFGPGQAAQSWLIGERAPTRERIEQIVPKYALEAARRSYFGGWFEIMAHGIVPGESHEYDINSAYPAIIAKLPCLEHGKWSRGKGLPPPLGANDLCLVRARVWTRTNLSHQPSTHRAYIGAMLHRGFDGRIYRPTITEGWFWWHELEAAKRAKCVQAIPKNPRENHPECHEWVRYEPCDCFPPLRHVVSLYLKRQAVGKDTPLGKGAKTVYNSEYGKFAQSVGSPLFGNPIYASLITAGCRTMILDAIATHPKGKANVLMVATDAVYFLDPHPSLDEGEGLGQWEHKTKSRLCLFKPGVYWDNRGREAARLGNTPHFKARGIVASDFAPQLARIDSEFDSWAGKPPNVANILGPSKGWPAVTFRVRFSMVTALQALQRNEWQLAGYVSDEEERTQSSNPYQKRTSVYYDQDRGIYRSEPFEPELIVYKTKGGEWMDRQDCKSTPYKKRFGMEDPWSIESKTEMGITPDGDASELLGFAWKALT
jgi:hypothetical protein